MKSQLRFTVAHSHNRLIGTKLALKVQSDNLGSETPLPINEKHICITVAKIQLETFISNHGKCTNLKLQYCDVLSMWRNFLLSWKIYSITNAYRYSEILLTLKLLNFSYDNVCMAFTEFFPHSFILAQIYNLWNCWYEY